MSSNGIRSVATAAAIALILMLSVQLVNAKRRVASLRGQIERSTISFTGGPLPAIPVRTSLGAATSLTSFCAEDRPALIIVTSPTCEACRAIRPLYERIASLRTDLRVVTMDVGALPGITAPDSVGVSRVFTTAAMVNAALRVSVVPAVIVANQGCTMAAAGAGTEPARAVLVGLLPDADRAEWARQSFWW